jgi:amino acid adenylation domain-containing protein
VSQETLDLAGLGPDQKRALLRRLLDGGGSPGNGRVRAPGTGDGRSDGAAVGRSYPTSYPQQRLWFMHKLNPTARAYHVESATPIQGPLDPDALSRALDRVVERHAVLRTTFQEVDGEPRQVVAGHLQIPMARVDLSGLPPGRREARAEELLRRWSYEPFNLETGPLVRAALLRLEPTTHVLALYLHHIVADGWSMGIFGRELDALYQEQVSGQPARLPALPVQYTDFAAWQRRHLRGAVLDSQLGYWRRALADLPTLDLPTDRPRRPIQDYQGDHLDVRLPRRLHQRLLAVGAAEGATLFMTLLAGYAALLSRWSGRSDLPIGTYVANRRRPELEQLVGFFLNTLVMRVQVDASASFRKLLRAVREIALGAYDHQDVPFELVVEALAPARDLSRNPLFQVVFQLNNEPTQDPRTNTVEAARARRDAAIFDLGLMMFETPDGLGGQFEYATALFDAATVRRLGSQFQVLLEAVVAAPDTPVADLPVLRPQERAALVAAPNRTARRHPWDIGLLDLFARQCRQRGQAIAFVEGRRSVGYRELDRAANRVAQALMARGAGPGERVGVLLDRSLAAPAAVLGVLKAGAAWVPLEPSWAPERLAACCAAAGVRLVLGVPGATLPDGTTLVDLRSALTTGPDRDPGRRPAPNDCAYVLFTSGSTGRPKAVAAPHGQILNRLHWMWREYPWRSDEVAAMKTSLSFVDAVWELFGALLQGVPTVVIPPGSVADAHELVELLRRRRVTRLWLVPSLLRSLLDDVPELRRRLPALNFWVASGEDLPLDLYRRFTAAMPGARLYNLYGTTEIWDATWCDPAEVDLGRGRVPIGHAIDNVRVYVLDRWGRPVPQGWPGFLHVAGAGLGFGYIGDPDLRRRRFRRVEVDQGRWERLYATGDRVVLRPDLELEYLGREDGQVKIRGMRVELGEVEAALAAHPGVRACAVRLVGDSDPELIAWYEPIHDPLDPWKLRAHLRRLLSVAAVPARFVVADPMPRTTSGKVDRARLPDPVTPHARAAPAEPPSGRLEEAVAAVWSSVLGGVTVGRDDDFFADLGGHSLLGVRALSRLRDRHGLDLPLRLLFEHPTVRGLAAAAGALPNASGAGEAGAIPALDREAYRRGGAT